MPRKLGTPKTGGRKAGTPNKITFDLMETLRAKGFDPAAAVLEVYLEAMQSYRERKAKGGFGGGTYLQIAGQSAEDLMSYVYPKRKAVELSGQGGADLFQSFTELMRELHGEKGE